MRAALNRFFKETQGLDIIANPAFIHANEMFKGVTKKGRHEGRGSLDHKKPINEGDMDTLSNYFTSKMQGPMNPCHLQELVLFSIIYFMGCHGRENLRHMKKIPFKYQLLPKDVNSSSKWCLNMINTILKRILHKAMKLASINSQVHRSRPQCFTGCLSRAVHKIFYWLNLFSLNSKFPLHLCLQDLT